MDGPRAIPPLDRPIVSPVLVGRGPALAALERVLAQVCAGRGPTVVLTGEAGIGKSRLAAEMAAGAERRGQRPPRRSKTPRLPAPAGA